MRMSHLHTYRDVIQGTEEWDRLRCGMVTASVMHQLVTAKTLKTAANDHSRAIVATIAAERITGWSDESFVSDDMWRGHVDEPVAADVYAKHYGTETSECGFLVREFDDYSIGYSPDRLVGDVGLLEVKSRRAKKHLQTIAADAIPDENLAQCQTALLVTGRSWLDYVSYCGGMRLWTKRVYPDPRWFDAITTAMTALEASVTALIDTYEKATNGMPLTERIDYYDRVELKL
jgi:hypothetical protein